MDYKSILMKIEEIRNNGLNTGSEPETNSKECPVCHGAPWVLYNANEHGQRQEDGKYVVAERCPRCHGAHLQRVRDWKRIAEIPLDLRLDSFDWSLYEGNIVQEQRIVRMMVDHYDEMEREGRGLYIWSRTRGTGKTFLASAILGELAERYEVRSCMVPVSTLLSMIKNKRDDGQDPLQRLVSFRLLVLDDIGQKRTGENWLNDVVYELLNERNRRNRVTLFTSNVPIQELGMDDRITDRIYEKAFQIHLPEESIRTRLANRSKEKFLRDHGILPEKPVT